MDAVPAIATVLRSNPAAADVRQDVRPNVLPAAASAPRTVVAPNLAEARTTAATASPVAQARPETLPGNGASNAPVAPPPVATAQPTMAPAFATPPVQLASAAPTISAPRPSVGNELKAISRDPPEFPKEAIIDGVKSGLVNARIHVSPRGNVTGVDILGGQPPKVFDRAVRKALMRWQFEPLAAGHTTDVDFDVDVKFQVE